MECDCEEVTSCEGISHSVTRKKSAKNILMVSNIVDTKIEPLFCLPPHLMECKRCKRKYKEQQERKRQETYTRKRLKTENFRR